MFLPTLSCTLGLLNPSLRPIALFSWFQDLILRHQLNWYQPAFRSSQVQTTLCYTNTVLNRGTKEKTKKKTRGKYQKPKNLTQAAATRGIGGLPVSCSWWSLALVSCGNDGLFSSSICSRAGPVTTETTQSLDIVKQSYFAVSDSLLLWVINLWAVNAS